MRSARRGSWPRARKWRRGTHQPVVRSGDIERRVVPFLGRVHVEQPGPEGMHVTSDAAHIGVEPGAAETELDAQPGLDSRGSLPFADLDAPRSVIVEHEEQIV